MVQSIPSVLKGTVSELKPLKDSEIENKILEILSPSDPVWSNAVFKELHVNKVRFQRIRDRMIDEEWIGAERNGRNLLLTRKNFEDSRFEGDDWTKITKINCKRFLEYLKNNRPLFKISKNKKIILKNKKEVLDAFFHELDRQMIVHTRLVNAEALGLILSTRSKLYQKDCIKLVQDFIKVLLKDHKEFKEEIKEYAQSILRTVQFKI